MRVQTCLGALLCALFVSSGAASVWAFGEHVYNRPSPLMDYSSQEVGRYDGAYADLLEADCRVCHGATMERHHLSQWGGDCAHCHDPIPNPPDVLPERDCVGGSGPNGCHNWDDDVINDQGGNQRGHHNSVEAAAGNCASCHDPTLVGNLSPYVSFDDVPPEVKVPTPFSCENCHWPQAVSNQSGNPANPGHPSTYDHYDEWGNPVGFFEYPRPVLAPWDALHMGSFTIVVSIQCFWCHGLGDEWLDPEPPGGQVWWEFTDPRISRPCQRCHDKAKLHAIHAQDFNGWEAVGFHVPDKPQTDPDFYGLFTAAEMCDGCHAPRQDVIGTIREKLSGRQGLYMCDAPNALDGDTDPSAMEKRFGNSNQGDNIIAMAYVDTDGDTIHEVAVIRQRSTGRQRLEIYDHDGTSLLASDLSFGDLNSDKNNIAMSSLDLDGDGTDEIAVVRQKQTGKQQLFIFNPPQGVGGQTEPPIATDKSFGFSGTGRNIIAMTGLDTNTDGIDEIAVIMERTNGRQRLEIYNVPLVVGGETGVPIASDLIFGNRTTNKNNIAITSLDVNLNQIDEIAVVRQKLNGRQRLEIYNAPSIVGGDTGSPIASDLTFGQSGTDIYTKFISGMRF